MISWLRVSSSAIKFAEAALVVEPGLVVSDLVVGQDPGDGLAVYLAGPLVVGAVQEGGSA